ncbi:MAG: DUF4058 family protein [Cyanothece sp. SIO1E1]|nr:DUF4058 family protein [Cyanothece sp. SIO1E1]
MPSPFPGMDPYLENPELWPEVHSRLIVALADAIASPLLPNYYVAIEKRTYFAYSEESVLVGIPDVSVLSERKQADQALKTNNNLSTATLSRSDQPQSVTVPLSEEIQERYLEIRETNTGTVVTTIEVLSPKNKRSGQGRDAYLRKRQQILTSYTHLVEIDLLRNGTPMPVQGEKGVTDYRILLSRSDTRPQAQLYAFNLRDTIPAFVLPLKTGDEEPRIELKSSLDGIYDRAGYRFRIDYNQAASPALSAPDIDWADALLVAQGLRLG